MAIAIGGVSNTMSSLSFEHITIQYTGADKSQTRAVQDFSLEVDSGCSVVFIGPSGCGKSSLLRVAAGLQVPTAGSLLINGESTCAPRKNTALILQDFGLLPWKTVYQNAELGLKIHKVETTERARRTRDALQKVGLAGFESAYPKELSGGMQQRLALARALAMDVNLLLMDEPLSALDALLREEMQDTLLQLWQNAGYTQILVTHSIEEAVYLGQRIVVLSPRPGRVVAQIENPGVGTKDYRTTTEFFDTCRTVRHALEQAVDTIDRAQRSGAQGRSLAFIAGQDGQPSVESNNHASEEVRA